MYKYIGNLIQGLKVCVLFGKRAAGVSARQEHVPARYVRAARSVFRVITATGWGVGVSVDGFRAEGRRPRPLMVESIAHFERRFRDGGDMAQMEGSGSNGGVDEPLRGCLNFKP